MAVVTINLPPRLPVDIGEEIAKRACYCDPRITGCRFDSETRQLRLSLDNGAQPDRLVSRVKRLIERMKSERLTVTPATLKKRRGQSAGFNHHLIEELTEAGDLTQEGTGVIGRSGRLLALLQRFDALLTRIAVKAFDAEVKDYGVLIPTDWLRRAGYFTSFAHSLTFAFHLRENYDQLESFTRRHREGANLHFESLDEIATPEYCLSPAVCYHAYGAMQKKRLDETDHGLRVQTAGGRCFRYESKNITDLDRLWEFSMREIIFVGEKERVLEARRRAIEIIWRLIEHLDFTATLETASDPFFATDFQSLRFFQLANELKYELRLPIDENKSVAAASFNYHELFFGQNFDIDTAAGDKVHTGCAAFGLERLVYAALSQHGYDVTVERLDHLEHNLAEILEGVTP